LKPDVKDIEQKKLEKLLDQLREGSIQAYHELERRFRPELEYFVYQLTKSEIDARNIVTETLGTMFKLQKSFNSYNDLRAYVFVSSRNKAYDHLRYINRIRKNEMLVDDIVALAHVPEPDFEARAEAEAIRTRLIHTLHDQIARLKPQQKSVMQYILEGRSTAEIASAMGLREDLVRQLKSRAIFKIRKNLGDTSHMAYYILLAYLAS